MSGRRHLAAVAGWVLVLTSAAVALQISGQGFLTPPPLTDPSRWPGWLDGRDPVVASFALVRVAALVALWYLVAVTVVGVLLRLAGALRMASVADRITVAPVRRVLAGTVGLGLAASGVLAVAAPPTRLPVAAAQSATTTTPTAGVQPGTVTMHQLSPAEPVPTPGSGATSPAEVTPPTTAPSDRWTVEPGQCFWSIAESVLADKLGRAPGDAEVAPYWRRLIEANRGELAHRENPDLIFPGQVFAIPAP